MGNVRREMDGQGRLKCSKCGEWLYTWDFYRNKRTAHGVSTWCKSCMKANQRKYSPQAVRRRQEEREQAAREELARQTEEIRTRAPLGPPYQIPDDWITDADLERLVQPPNHSPVELPSALEPGSDPEGADS